MLEKMDRIYHSCTTSYYADRLYDELTFASRLSQLDGGKYDQLLWSAEQLIGSSVQETGGIITPSIMLQTEELLSPISSEAKGYTIRCAGHAHIDMNWLWGFSETVGVVTDTVTTILTLMKQFPDFRFSQSQASVYRILEQYRPDLLEQVKKRIHAGQWEVTAPTWVEHDKNMPNGESQARHLLYAKRYLAELLDLCPDDICVNFEPDTFGHNAMEPELLTQAGVRYYYHCRGNEEIPQLYRWRSASGAELLVNREKDFYFAKVDGKMALQALEISSASGLKTSLRVYGVGDHGGGPTVKDIERIADMDKWPVFPRFLFSSYREFFEEAETVRETLPIHTGEINFIFDGCYSSQSRIKAANKELEKSLYVSETWDSLARMAGVKKHQAGRMIKDAWEKVLFNQFHDIITGSGVRETREYAMGLYQEARAIVQSREKKTLQDIAMAIATDNILKDKDADDEKFYLATSYGAGVGSGQVERGQGFTRIYHVFNALPYERTENIEFRLWEWAGDTERLAVFDDNGRRLEHQILDTGRNIYWGHSYVRVLARVRVPSCGYTTIIAREDRKEIRGTFHKEKRQQIPERFVLENELIHIVIDSRKGGISSVVDKETGFEYIGGDEGGVFKLITEASRKSISGWTSEMSAWLQGRYKQIEILNNLPAEMWSYSGSLRQSVFWKASFGNGSIITAEFVLEKGARSLRVNVNCDWNERGSHEKGVPVLSWTMPFAWMCNHYLQDIPFGTIVREGRDADLPALSYTMCRDGHGHGVQLISRDTYGWRCNDNSIGLTILRASHEPDPVPEKGICQSEFAIAFLCGMEDDITSQSRMEADCFTKSGVISNGFHQGSLPLTSAFMSKEGGAGIHISALKEAEEAGIVLRLYETEGKDEETAISFSSCIRSASYVDILETKDTGEVKLVSDNTVRVVMPANSIRTLRVIFTEN